MSVKVKKFFIPPFPSPQRRILFEHVTLYAHVHVCQLVGQLPSLCASNKFMINLRYFILSKLILITLVDKSFFSVSQYVQGQGQDQTHVMWCWGNGGIFFTDIIFRCTWMWNKTFPGTDCEEIATSLVRDQVPGIFQYIKSYIEKLKGRMKDKKNNLHHRVLNILSRYI